MPPKTLPPLPSAPTHSPSSFLPIDIHSRQGGSDPDLARGAGDRRPRGLAKDDQKRPRSNSTPPDSRIIHDRSLQPRTGFPPVSANNSRAWGMTRGYSTGNVSVDVTVQAQGLIQTGGRSATHFLANFNPLRRRNSDIHSEGFAPGRSSASTPVDSPVIPRGSITDGRPPTRPRKNSHPRPRILFYHKHEPHYGFTNFSTHPVIYQGRTYPTSEHLFQAFKFTHRPGLAEHIRTCSSRPSVAFSEARRFAQEVRSDWGRDNINVMNLVIYHKFTQHKDLRRELLATGDAELIENSDKDAFWGCGADGKGKNELGKALERLRTRLREEERR